MNTWTTCIRYIAFICLVGWLCSCQTEDEEWQSVLKKNTIQVMGRVTEFQDHYVSSRALKSNEEALIKNMSIFIFKSDGSRAHYEWIEGTRPVFVIDREELNGKNNPDANDFKNSKIYILANVPKYAVGQLPANEAALGDKFCNVNGIGLLDGFPMIGDLSVDLEPSSDLEDNILEVSLENLYSKIVFNLKVNTDQSLEGFVPSFRLQEWEVHHVPVGVAFGNKDQTDFYNSVLQEDGEDKVFRSTEVEGMNPVSGAYELSFSFYMPEHKVDPAVSATDYFSQIPGIKDHEKQRHKPCLVDKLENSSIPDSYAGKPTYVVLKGVFTDHQGYMKNVSYKIYLGEDNYSNFQINRNCQYNNNVTIRGVTNHIENTDDIISVDHRVTVEKDEFTFYVERETHLDSHFEVRPIDIEFEKEGVNYEGSRVELVLLTSMGEEPANHNMQYLPGWVRFENMNAIADGSVNHCSNGKRLYFTEDLVTNTLKNNYTTTIRYNDTSKRIWTYFDENTASTKGTRSATIRAKYYEKDAATPTKVMDFKFQQRNLHPVSYSNRSYLIEYYEEYLYNFDPKDNYGNTTDGMEWGLDGVQLSQTYDAVYLKNKNSGVNIVSILEYFGLKMTEYLNSLMEGNMPKYDFYLARDKESLGLSDELTIRDYGGYNFTQEIIDVAIQNDKVSDGTLSSVAESAAEYCYNKNKRNSNGEVVNMKWYLPSIDEIEEITMGGYTEFEVFQDKYYWSSQPAYQYNDIKSLFYTKFIGWIKYAELEGKSFTDDVYRARATKVDYKGNNIYENVTSGVSGALGTQQFSYKDEVINDGFTNASPPPTPNEGNMPRTGQINRIRCVYKK